MRHILYMLSGFLFGFALTNIFIEGWKKRIFIIPAIKAKFHQCKDDVVDDSEIDEELEPMEEL